MAQKASEDKEWLENNIYTHLKPVIYPQKEFIFRIGEPLDSMLYIVDGIVITYTTAGSPSMILKDTTSSTTGSQSIKAHIYVRLWRSLWKRTYELGINIQHDGRHGCLLRKPSYLNRKREMSYQSRRLCSHGHRVENCIRQVGKISGERITFSHWRNVIEPLHNSLIRWVVRPSFVSFLFFNLHSVHAYILLRLELMTSTVWVLQITNRPQLAHFVLFNYM